MCIFRVGLALALVACCISQFAPRGFGRFNQFRRGFNRPMGLSALTGRQAYVGYNPALSSLVRTGIHSNLGRDASTTYGANCVRGIRGPGGECICQPGYEGAICNTPVADLSLAEQQGVICQQTVGTYGSLDTLAQERTRAIQRGAVAEFDLQEAAKEMMSGPSNGQGRRRGPGVALFCPNIPSNSPISPVNLKSAVTDYGFVQCSADKTCYNQLCPACMIFNPASGVCERVSNPAARGLPSCFDTPEGSLLSSRVMFYRTILQRPKMSPEPQGNAMGPNVRNVGAIFPGRNPMFG